MIRTRELSAGLLAAVFLAGTAASGDSTPKITADVVYGHKDGMALTFDVLQAPTPNGAAVIYIPTGGWYSPYFTPEVAKAAAAPYLERGFTFIVLRHGSAPKYTVPECVADVRRAVRYIRLHAADFGVEPERLGVYGASAGGHLTLMLATTGDDGQANEEDEVVRTSSRIACAVSIFPPTDLRGWTTDDAPKVIKDIPGLKPPLSFATDLEDDVSPILHVTEQTPPVLLIHGDRDELVPIAHSEKLIPVLEKANVECRLLTIEGAGHGFDKEQQKVVSQAMLDWFETHLATP